MVEHSESYWNDLLDQYKSGSISEDKRFALERRALDDPFLFDALEGFELYGKNEEKESTKSKLLTLPRMAAAASVIFLVSMTFLLKNTNRLPNRENQSIAMVLDTESDETILDESSSSETPVDEKENQEGIDQQTKPKEQVVNQSTKKDPTSQPREKNKKSREAISTSTTSGKTESLLEKNTVDQKILEESGVSESIESEDEEVSDPKQIESVNVSKAAKMVPTKEKPNVGSSLEQTADVSVSNDASAKMKKKEEVSVFYIVEPEIGKRYFDEFVQQKIDALDLRQSPPVETIIEFTIHPDGSIDEFTHILDKEDGCSICGAQAIAILQSSGVWRTVPAGNTGRARYKFIF